MNRPGSDPSTDYGNSSTLDIANDIRLGIRRRSSHEGR